MHVFAVVVTHNGMQWIDKCLGSLKGNGTQLSVIVVDNNSTDGTAQFIKKYFSEVDLIEDDDNRGFGEANNRGIKRALERGADYLFLLNQDAWVEQDTIDNLVKIHQRNPSFGILSPMHLNADHSAIDYNFSRYIIPDYCPGLYSDIYLGHIREIYQVDFVNAAAWLISRDCMGKVGLFDPLFFHYGEDRNFCQRTLYHGFKIGICPHLRIIHDREGRKGVAKEYKGVKERRRLFMIVFTNVRDQYALRKLRFYLIKTFLLVPAEMLAFRFKPAGVYFGDFFFFLKMHKKIRSSIRRNRQIYQAI